jgi:hypothetical protein
MNRKDLPNSYFIDHMRLFKNNPQQQDFLDEFSFRFQELISSYTNFDFDPEATLNCFCSENNIVVNFNVEDMDDCVSARIPIRFFYMTKDDALKRIQKRKLAMARLDAWKLKHSKELEIQRSIEILQKDIRILTSALESRCELLEEKYGELLEFQ